MHAKKNNYMEQMLSLQCLSSYKQTYVCHVTSTDSFSVLWYWCLRSRKGICYV